MKLIDMARERTATEAMPMPAANEPYFPFGLSLTLDAESLEELGVEGLPSAGTQFHLEAVGVITHSSSCDPDADGDVDGMCVTLQIKQLGFEHGKPPKRDAGSRAHRMYAPKEG